MVSIATKAGESTARTRAYHVFPVDISYLVAEGHLKGSFRRDRDAVAKAVEHFLASASVG
jgi:hypothetical protein